MRPTHLLPLVVLAAAGGSHASIQTRSATNTTTSRPWLDPRLPTETRLQAFLAQLTPAQKFAMTEGDDGMGSNCSAHITGVAALGVPDICVGDGPGGVNSLGKVTVFPAPVMAASTWDVELECKLFPICQFMKHLFCPFFLSHRPSSPLPLSPRPLFPQHANTHPPDLVGQSYGQEQRSKSRTIIGTPTINMVRSPMFARSAETFGEDPLLTARMAVAQIRGIQSQGVGSCVKHLAAYNQDTNRFGPRPLYPAADMRVSRRVMHELYLPAFKAAVQEGEVAAVMTSYNKLNGVYTSENAWLVNQTLKTEWGFNGTVMTDWLLGTRSGVAAALAGTDISMPGGTTPLLYDIDVPDYYSFLPAAVRNGSVPMARIDDMVARTWRFMFDLGVVDRVGADPAQASSYAAEARTEDHRAVAQRVAEEGTVLLKNEGGTLPLRLGKYKKIGIFGDATNTMQISESFGGFVNTYSPSSVSAPLSALRTRAAADGMSVAYARAYPGLNAFPTLSGPTAFKDGQLRVTYWDNGDWAGAPNASSVVPNVTIGNCGPGNAADLFSCVYEGVLLVGEGASGEAHFSLNGGGDALLYLDGELVANMSKVNTGATVQGVARLEAGAEVNVTVKYSSAYELEPTNSGVELGMSPGNATRDDEADALAAESDVNIIFVGDQYSEGKDNTYGLTLPGSQDALITRLARQGHTRGAKTVVVLLTNSAVLMPWLADVDAVLEAWYPGQEAGAALARLLFGDVSPSGKLPVSFPRALEDTIAITDAGEVAYDEGLEMGYRRFDARGIEPLFHFGHGLTYSDFDLVDMRLAYGGGSGERRVDAFRGNRGAWDATAASSSSFLVTASLRNVGPVAASQVVQLYVAYPAAAAEPPKLLKGFARVADVPARSAELVSIRVQRDDLRIWDEDVEDWRLVRGEYTFMLAFSAGDVRLERTVVL